MDQFISKTKIKEKYPSYASLKNCRKLKPTRAKIVLIHPGSIDNKKSAKKRLYNDLSAASSMHPPQSLCSLASILRESGYNPIILDSVSLNLDPDETAEKALKSDPKYIGITSYTISIEVAGRIASLIKGKTEYRDKSIITIIGGPHVTVSPRETMYKYSEFDYGVFGEGEITIVELLDALENGEELINIPNLIYRKGNQIRKNLKRSLLNDLDQLPIPAWDLLPPIKKYYHPAGDNLNRLPSIAIVTSRGCPGKCVFCNPRGLGNKFRGHSAKYIFKMLRELKLKFGIRDVFIADDMFLYDRKNVLEFCEIMKGSKDLNITWSVFSRVDFVDKEILIKIKKAGCWQIGYGLESGSEAIQKIINKKQTIEQMENALKATNDVGLIVRGLFMVGNFGETEETLKETIAFIKRNGIKDFHVTYFTPMPGTASFSLHKQFGVWDNENSEGSDKSQHEITFVPFGLTKKELIAYQRKIYLALLLKAPTIWYHFKKVFRPSLTLFIIKGGIAFLMYILFSKYKKID